MTRLGNKDTIGPEVLAEADSTDLPEIRLPREASSRQTQTTGCFTVALRSDPEVQII